MNKLVDRIDAAFDRIKFRPKPLLGILLLFLLVLGMHCIDLKFGETAVMACTPIILFIYFVAAWCFTKSRFGHKFLIVFTANAMIFFILAGLYFLLR